MIELPNREMTWDDCRHPGSQVLEKSQSELSRSSFTAAGVPVTLTRY
jgi:hypothetical protein